MLMMSQSITARRSGRPPMPMGRATANQNAWAWGRCDVVMEIADFHEKTSVFLAVVRAQQRCLARTTSPLVRRRALSSQSISSRWRRSTNAAPSPLLRLRPDPSFASRSRRTPTPTPTRPSRSWTPSTSTRTASSCPTSSRTTTAPLPPRRIRTPTPTSPPPPPPRRRRSCWGITPRRDCSRRPRPWYATRCWRSWRLGRRRRRRAARRTTTTAQRCAFAAFTAGTPTLGTARRWRRFVPR